MLKSINYFHIKLHHPILPIEAVTTFEMSAIYKTMNAIHKVCEKISKLKYSVEMNSAILHNANCHYLLLTQQSLDIGASPCIVWPIVLSHSISLLAFVSWHTAKKYIIKSTLKASCDIQRATGDIQVNEQQLYIILHFEKLAGDS